MNLRARVQLHRLQGLSEIRSDLHGSEGASMMLNLWTKAAGSRTRVHREKKKEVEARHVKLRDAAIDHERQNNRIVGIISIILTPADPGELPSKLLINYKPYNLWTSINNRIRKSWERINVFYRSLVSLHSSLSFIKNQESFYINIIIYHKY